MSNQSRSKSKGDLAAQALDTASDGKAVSKMSKKELKAALDATGEEDLYDPKANATDLRQALLEYRARAWRKRKPSNPYPPMTWPIACAVACRMAERGKLLHGVAVLTSFHCLLRVGEMTNLRKSDIALQNDDRLGVSAFKGALRLRKTKTGPNQWVTVRDESIYQLLQAVTVGLAKEDRVFPFSASTFRRSLRSTCLELGISTPYVPHSLRHGGATKLHLEGMPVEDIMLRGRWQSSKSARRYIQSGQALLLSISAPGPVVAAGRLFARSILKAIAFASARAQSGQGQARL